MFVGWRGRRGHNRVVFGGDEGGIAEFNGSCEGMLLQSGCLGRAFVRVCSILEMSLGGNRNEAFRRCLVGRVRILCKRTIKGGKAFQEGR